MFEITVYLEQDGVGQNPNIRQPPFNKFRALLDLCGTNMQFRPFQSKLRISLCVLERTNQFNIISLKAGV
jgi:hypothetical protein